MSLRPSRVELANAIRALSMDAVQKANSGHPGMPMGMADIAEVLWNDFLQHNPLNPHWPNRDRFVLSNGHGCMLQYALLHLTGYDLSLQDIQSFRQLHSKTPGHPEFGVTPGVETTTGPLGQGFANAVGMALAEKLLASEFNRDQFNIVDNTTYCFVGDGCLMEGISHEAASLAGTLGLGKLIAFWDDNGISIDGEVKGWFLDNTPERFKAYGWHVIPNVDGHDPKAIYKAIVEARKVSNKPSLICCKTHIAFGAPNLMGSHKAHGSPLGNDEIQAARKKLNWTHEPFYIPDDIYKAWNAKEKGIHLEHVWLDQFEAYKKAYPELAKEFQRRLTKQLPSDWESAWETHIQAMVNNKNGSEKIATRKASQQTLEFLAPKLPELLGGSADLSESNLTLTSVAKPIQPQKIEGNYIYYGVREFAMFAIMNGIAVYEGFIPYGGTFLVFLDYGRNAARLSALMRVRVIYVLTHDSVGLGEDGPTHQPIEHLTILRATPNMSLWRPCDAVETALAWKIAIERKGGPTSLALSRQPLLPLPASTRTPEKISQIKKGGYILMEGDGSVSGKSPHAIVIATGSEVALAVEAAQQLAKEGTQVRVVSMPSTDTFLKQPKDYQEEVLPSHVSARVAVEAGATAYWYSFVGLKGVVVGIDRFGESAPGNAVFEDVGLTTAAVVAAIRNVI